MLVEPGFHDGGRPVWKDVDWAVWFHIYDDRALPVPLANGNIINSNEAEWANRWKFS